MKTKLILTTTFACFLAISAQAETQSFDFKDPKGVNNATFKLDAPLEAITGTANGISGTVSYDAEKPESLTGKIVVETKSLTIPNPVMTDHMRGADWLDAAKFPEITFEAAKVANVKRDGDNTTADVTGKFTMHGAGEAHLSQRQTCRPLERAGAGRPARAARQVHRQADRLRHQPESADGQGGG